MDLIIADDRALSRQCLSRVLGARDEFRVVAEAAHADQLLEILPDEPATIVIVECALPGQPLPQLVRRIRSRRRSPRVLLIGALPGHPGVRAALRSGASGALCRDATESILLEALRKVAAGGQYVCPALAEPAAPPVPGLSAREFDVLRLLGSGRSGREIADQLELSPKTVSTYRARILKKLGLRNVAELVRYAVDHGLAY